MKKVIIINYHPMTQAGGVQSVISAVVQGKSNYAILTGSDNTKNNFFGKSKTYKTNEFYSKNPTTKLKEFLDLVFAKENPTIIYTHNLSYMFSADVAEFIFNYFKKRGCIMIEHTHHAMIRRQARAKRILKLDWDAVICVSNYAAKRIFPNTNQKTKKYVIYNSINLKNFNKEDNSIRKELGIKDKIVLVFPSRTVRLSTGKIGEQKQFMTVLKAIKGLKEKEKYALLIPNLGDKNNPKVKEFYNLIKNMGLEEIIFEFPKKILQEEMYKFYSTGDITLFPSIGESFGMITIESWACKKPIIGAKSGGITEIIKDYNTGLLFEPQSPKSLREKIELLSLDKELYSKIQSRGFLESKKFSQEKMQKEINKVFDSIKSKKKIYLIRHGETIYNARNIFTGQANPPLTKKGKNQAKRLKDFVKNLDNYKAYCSPLKRSLDTAKISGVKEPAIIDELKEIDVGTFESKTREEIEKELGKIDFEKIKYAPKGESLKDLKKRLTPFVKKINKNKDTVIVAHEVVNKSLASMLTGEDYFSIKHQKNEDIILISNKKIIFITLN